MSRTPTPKQAERLRPLVAGYAIIEPKRGEWYSAGYRCWSCRLFVSGPTVTCSHCGQPHGGIHHEAYVSR